MIIGIVNPDLMARQSILNRTSDEHAQEYKLSTRSFHKASVKRRISGQEFQSLHRRLKRRLREKIRSRSQADSSSRRTMHGLQEPDLVGLRGDCGTEPTFKQTADARTSFTHASGDVTLGPPRPGGCIDSGPRRLPVSSSSVTST